VFAIATTSSCAERDDDRPEGKGVRLDELALIHNTI
jgi:hypothetical protein